MLLDKVLPTSSRGLPRDFKTYPTFIPSANFEGVMAVWNIATFFWDTLYFRTFWELLKYLLYSVIFFICLRKQVCCELVSGLMGNPKAVLRPQDWNKMTIRPEILLNNIKNEFGRWWIKGRNWRSGDLSMLFRVSKMDSCFNPPHLTPYHSKVLPFSVITSSVLL